MTAIPGTKIPLKIFARREQLDYILEASFLRNSLLAQVRRPVSIYPIEPKQPFPRLDNALYLTLLNFSVAPITEAITAGCKNIGVLHMGDELGELDCSWYQDVDYVLRNYWFEEKYRLPPGSRCQKVLWLPNGYANGTGPRPRDTLLPASMREISYFFSGRFPENHPSTAERHAMLQAVTDHQIPAFLNATDGFGEGYKAASYSALNENARFSLVPKGGADETIRLFDAMECGSIPISLCHPFLEAPEAMGSAPIVKLESWQQLPQLHARIQSLSDEQLDEIQREVISWWWNYKEALGGTVADLIEGSFARHGVA